MDFRWLNENTLSDGYPLPRIEDILVKMGRKRIFSVIDLKDAFHQVPMHPDSMSATATSTPKGTLLWKVLAQGLKNGPPTFQRVIDYVLRSVGDCAAPCFDDVIIASGDPGDTWTNPLKK